MENSPLARLPREIRDKIYIYTMREDDDFDKEKGLEQQLNRYEWRSFHHLSLVHPILKARSQLKTECLPIYFEQNHFIESPWRIRDKSHGSAECDFPNFIGLIRHYYHGNIKRFGIKIEDESLTQGNAIMLALSPSQDRLAGEYIEMMKLCEGIKQTMCKHDLQPKHLVVQIRYIVPLLKNEATRVPRDRIPLCLWNGEDSTCDLVVDIFPYDFAASLGNFMAACGGLARKFHDEVKDVLQAFGKEQRQENRDAADLIKPNAILNNAHETIAEWMILLETYHGGMMCALTDAWTTDAVEVGELKKRLDAVVLGSGESYGTNVNMLESVFGRRIPNLSPYCAFLDEASKSSERCLRCLDRVSLYHSRLSEFDE